MRPKKEAMSGYLPLSPRTRVRRRPIKEEARPGAEVLVDVLGGVRCCASRPARCARRGDVGGEGRGLEMRAVIPCVFRAMPEGSRRATDRWRLGSSTRPSPQGPPCSTMKRKSRRWSDGAKGLDPVRAARAREKGRAAGRPRTRLRPARMLDDPFDLQRVGHVLVTHRAHVPTLSPRIDAVARKDLE